MNSLFSSLSIIQLKTLLVILEQRNLTHAAATMGSSQSALSRQLAHYRAAFDDPLLVRQGKQFLLTDKASALLAPLSQILQNLDSLAQPLIFDPGSCTRRFSIAASDYVATHILPDLIRHLRQVAPGVCIDYLTWQPNRYDWLSSGKVDLATTLVEDAPPEFHGRIIGDDIPVCCLRSDHSLANAEKITLSDYLNWSHIKISGGGDKDGFIDNYLKQQQVSRVIRLSVPFFSAALDVAAQSDNLLTIPRYLLEHSVGTRPLTWRPLDFATWRFRYWVVWHRRTHNSPEHQWFRQFVYQHCQASASLNPGSQNMSY